MPGSISTPAGPSPEAIEIIRSQARMEVQLSNMVTKIDDVKVSVGGLDVRLNKHGEDIQKLKEGAAEMRGKIAAYSAIVATIVTILGSVAQKIL